MNHYQQEAWIGRGAAVGEAGYAVRDFVVVLPGIMGSTLSRDGVLVWAPSAGAALRAVRTFGGSLKQLLKRPGFGRDWVHWEPALSSGWL